MNPLIKHIAKIILLPAVCAIVFTACEKGKDAGRANPKADKLDPTKASGGTVLTLTGTDLAEIRSIVFGNGSVPAPFNPNFNTENAVIFRVPDTANGGDQDITFTNVDGKTFKVPFSVVALPKVSTAYPVDFQTGSTITLTGGNLESVSKVLLEGTTAEATIVSKEKKKLVITMPAATVNTCKLVITNTSGTSTTTQVFTNVDAAYGVFKDALHPDWEDWSWSLTNAPFTADKITGTASMQAAYSGAWGGMQLHAKVKANLAPYKFVTFWIKGADVEKKFKFNFNWTNDQTVTVPPNVWTYYKFDLSIFKNAGVAELETFVMQINDDPKTLYFDNILLVK
ncbi:IPT/TIG domain-containing protein [Paraflavitalea sp. CAU 1676]|uniref:IPT/TIG domain-containing protein n=1 Tax=Paraflavitalea sp. CAU 1676 TaxID=3032598 RepID=UPI0023DCB071|nr:IPT/TIG domain-containing protein [Paraflavitalea sp. CAU 1676]MDF2188836.1 IPT/TIG domain-containing protein [Paraflavitalea sp. CAU 1676]